MKLPSRSLSGFVSPNPCRCICLLPTDERFSPEQTEQVQKMVGWIFSDSSHLWPQTRPSLASLKLSGPISSRNASWSRKKLIFALTLFFNWSVVSPEFDVFSVRILMTNPEVLSKRFLETFHLSSVKIWQILFINFCECAYIQLPPKLKF